MSKPLLSAKDLAAELGLHPSQVTRLRQSGAISPEILEGRLVRFDLDKVKRALAKRAKEHQREEAEHLPDGMVPTY